MWILLPGRVKDRGMASMTAKCLTRSTSSIEHAGAAGIIPSRPADVSNTHNIHADNVALIITSQQGNIVYKP